MGTITDINSQIIQAKLDEGKEISFSPNLNPHFDQGWAVTIHKSQGTTVDQTYVLASFEMTQNLTYVAMTRHREDVHMFGSSLDFWRPEKLPEVLSKSGEKLSAVDYLDAKTLSKIMKRDDQLITKFFQRLSNELEAMGVVTKEAFWNLADHFLGKNSLGRTREKEIRVLQEGVREEVRAEELFKKECTIMKDSHSSQSQYKSLSQGASQASESKSEKLSSSLSLIESPLVGHTRNAIKISETAIQQKLGIYKPHKKEVVEEALKANMADFADHVFVSIGEDYNRSMSSRTERRYGKKEEFSVNLQKGVWCSHKDSQLKGGPLQLLTQIKNLSPKEAIDYGASWARLSPEQLTLQKRNSNSSRSQKETIEKAREEQETRQKIKRAKAFWAKGQLIQGTLAERYLKEHRKIQGDLPKDLLYLPANSIGKASPPCLMAVARSNEGEITAVQLTFLDPVTANKADILVQKRSFGSLKGSAVMIQQDKESNLLFIAEGVETALSIKEAGIKGTIKASLGLSNIKHLEPKDQNVHVIICGDHDAPDSSATKSLEKSANTLQERAYKVIIIKPDNLGEDFNDVLKTKGPAGVREILLRNLPKSLRASIQSQAEKLPQRDSHASEPTKKKEETHPFKNEKETSEFTLKGKSFQEIVAYCEKRLHDALTRDKKPLTQERIRRFPLQAEKTATFLIHNYEHSGRHPTEEELVQFSLRAKYELNRISEIRKELIKKWKNKDSFKENDGLLAHMIAERLASIEGRLYLKAKQNATQAPLNIAELAQKELKEHRAHTQKLAEELSQKYTLSKDTATISAKNIWRYKEIHGELPSESQIVHMVQIAQKLETQDYSSLLSKKYSHFEIDYYRRREGDLFFKHMTCQKEEEIDVNLPYIQAQIKKSLDAITSQIAQEFIKMNQKEYSL